MNRRLSALVTSRALALLVASGALVLATGCGGEVVSPVGGTWTYTQSACGVVPASAVAVDFEEDGSVEETLTLAAPNSGAIHISGLSWSTSSNTMTISGTPSCSGGFAEVATSPAHVNSRPASSAAPRSYS